MISLVIMMLVKTTIELDIYFIRHGVRAPLYVDVAYEFKVKKAELTQQGKCQAYYFGKQLKFRYPNISEQQLTIMSASKNRAYETAIYASKGWYQFNQKNGSKTFFLNSKYKPPVSLCYWPETKQMIIDQNLYKKKIIILDNRVNYGQVCVNTNYKEHQQYKKLVKMIPCDQYCQRIQNQYPNYCNSKYDKGQTIQNILDLNNCLEFYNKTIPLTAQQMKPIIQLKNVKKIQSYFNRNYQIATAAKMIQLIIDVLQKGKKKLVLSFTHDHFIFVFLGIFMGKHNFQKLFPYQINMPFLSNLHIKIKNSKVSVFFNDKRMKLIQEITGKNGQVNQTHFFEYLKKYTKDYDTICKQYHF